MIVLLAGCDIAYAAIDGSLSRRTAVGLGCLMASGIMACLPVDALFDVFQRFVVQGNAMDGSK